MAQIKTSGLEKMMNQKGSDFTFEIDKIKNGNSKKGFKHVKPKDIEEELDKTFVEGKDMGDSSGIQVLDSVWRWRKKGGLYLISGYEGSGKSEMLKYLCKLAAELYRWKVAMFSPEEETESIIEDLARTYLGKNTNKKFKNQCTIEEWEKAKAWINEHFTFLEYDGMVDFKTLLDEYEKLAKDGTKVFVTDPWNYVAEGAFDDNGIKYLKVALSHMKTFSRRYCVHNIIVEHQNNPKPNLKGNIPKASKYNITGGSMWRNKTDSIVLLHTNWTPENKDTRIDFEVAKSKDERYNSQKGTRSLWFEIKTGRYLESDPTENSHSEETLKLNFSESQRTQSDDDTPF